MNGRAVYHRPRGRRPEFRILDPEKVGAARALMSLVRDHTAVCGTCGPVVERMEHPSKLCDQGRGLLAAFQDRFTAGELAMAEATLECEECNEVEHHHGAGGTR